jgi:probable rRNA maturation factor
VLACDDARIRALNAQFRGKDAPTNVLSWPAEDLSADRRAPPLPGPSPAAPTIPAALGDIALAFETCAREAEAQGKRWRITRPI